MKALNRLLTGLLAVAMAWAAPCLAIAQPAKESQSEVRGILYRVRQGDVTVYLLGSIHIGNEEMYPFGGELTEAMEAADTFYFECDTTSRPAVELTQKTMRLEGGTRLQDVIHPEMYEKLEQVCGLSGYSVSKMSELRPWAVMSTLSANATAAEMGVDGLKKALALGVEARVREYAQQNRRDVAYLETTQEQLDVMNGFSMPLQLYLLDTTLNVILDPSSATGMDANMGLWPSWWRQGDAEAFAESFHQGKAQEAEFNLPLLTEYYGALITARNGNMARRVAALLEAPGPHTYFVTVGLLHLVLPEDSVVKCLQDAGYAVEWLSGDGGGDGDV